MNVLSLFDGISVGQLALNTANKPITNYFASEIDINAIKITNINFANTKQLGDIKNIQASNLPKIDLLIGGSPCQGFSKAGKREGLNDNRSFLFFEYVRLLNTLQPKYFFLENVKLNKENEKIFNDNLKVQGITINSALVSKQNRVRTYWTNIPLQKIIDKELYYNKYLYQLPHGYVKSSVKLYKKYPTLVAQSPSSKYRLIEDESKVNESEFDIRYKYSRCLTAEECEELQTLPIGYTSGVAKTNRYKIIGNSWTHNVILEFFKNL